jgi:hypothetical protein
MVKEIKTKATESYKTARRMEKHFEEILSAVSLTTVTAFSGYQSWIHRQDGILWVLLGAASAYLATEAFRAWYRALNK